MCHEFHPLCSFEILTFFYLFYRISVPYSTGFSQDKFLTIFSVKYSGIVVTYMKLFQISDFLPSLCQDFFHIFQRDARLHHHNKEMIDKIAYFICRIFIFPVFCCNNNFTALLAAFFQNFVKSLFKKITGIGSFSFFFFSFLDYLIQPFHNIHHFFSSSHNSLKKQL